MYFVVISVIAIVAGVAMIARPDALSSYAVRRAKRWNHPKFLFAQQAISSVGYAFVLFGVTALIVALAAASCG